MSTLRTGNEHDEYVFLFVTRREMANAYRELLAGRGPGIDWSLLNNAIIRRWSVSGLRWIKRAAWKAPEEREP